MMTEQQARAAAEGKARLDAESCQACIDSKASISTRDACAACTAKRAAVRATRESRTDAMTPDERTALIEKAHKAYSETFGVVAARTFLAELHGQSEAYVVSRCESVIKSHADMARLDAAKPQQPRIDAAREARARAWHDQASIVGGYREDVQPDTREARAKRWNRQACQPGGYKPFISDKE